MHLMNKLTSSLSSFSLNNKRKRTPSMEYMTPLLQRIKRSFLNQSPTKNQKDSVRQSSTVHCDMSRKQEFDPSDDVNQKPVLLNTSDIKYYALRPERSMNDQKYPRPVENWWSSSPPVQQNNQQRSIMAF
ncbi:unnamed protein product [Mucor hiemalis]